MVCRLEKQRKHLGDVTSTVFDKLFSDTYYSKRQEPVPMDQTENIKKVKSDVLRSKRESVAGTINYMAPGMIDNRIYIHVHARMTFFYYIPARQEYYD
jgi:hypothetical protein